MGREEQDLKSAKKAYRDAERVGDHAEEARWSNIIGDILKQHGEYVEALRWLRIDYDLSVKYLPQKQLLPTCQSLGEVYLRLNRFKEALLYQKKHLQLAKDSDDLIEQQRASTQLGRTYNEIFLRSENDHYAIRNAKKYFKLAMKFSRILKEKPPNAKSSTFYLKEFIDSHNNIGMLEMDLDNLEEAEQIFLKGLKICDEEEISQNDDTRSRLNHNLGNLYIELRNWSKAKELIERDIVICKNISHKLGESKGYITLGELHYRVQKYDDAILCYKKANEIAKCLEDEDGLITQIKTNIETVLEAKKVLESLRSEEQILKKLVRAVTDARGTPSERKRLLEEITCLDALIEKSSRISAWVKHKEYAKRKKKKAAELWDKEKLGDSFLAIGESYQKLRNFPKARKWYMKSWNLYRSINNLEGQALAKINIGEVLDSSGDWAGALQAFEEGYKIAAKANLPSVQLSALENMHYSHMIRFDNLEEAKKLQKEITSLRQALKDENDKLLSDYHAESDSEGAETSSSNKNIPLNKYHTEDHDSDATEDLNADLPLSLLVHRRSNKSSRIKPEVLHESCVENKLVQRKRVRVVISDDESDKTHHIKRTPIHDNNNNNINNNDDYREVDSSASTQECNPVEESICSFKVRSPKKTRDDVAPSASKSVHSGSKRSGERAQISSSILQSHNDAGFNMSGNEHGEFLAFKIGERMIYVDVNSCKQDEHLCIDNLKAEVACVYYIQISEDRRSKGLLPVIGQLKCSGKDLDSFESIQDLKSFVAQQNCIDVLISGWVPKRLMKLYIDCCTKLSEPPSLKLLRKLYNLEVSEDEIIVSDCGLQDLSMTPFLNALQAHKTIAVLDISHNSLGNDTIEKLQEIFTSSSQKYGGLTLDLHCNRFGPTVLFQICECGVMSARLEVLNLSENRLTDACSSYLLTILQNCKALYSLNIEQCSITSRTIQKVSDALHEDSVLSHLSIGKNNPISGNAMVNLFSKLASLKRFSELSLTGIRLNKLILDQLCNLASSSSLSGLFLGGTCIGPDGAGKLMEELSSGSQELLKLDMSSCNLTSNTFANVCNRLSALSCIFHLDLSGNSISQEGSEAIATMLRNSLCSLRTLILNRCNLGLAGIITLIHSLSDNDSLEELHIAENTSTSLTPIILNPNLINMEVADSEDDEPVTNTTNNTNNNNNNNEIKINNLSKSDGSCASSCKRSLYVGSQSIQELAEALTGANQLKLIDLSRNGFEKEVVDPLYSAWGSGLRGGDLTRKHVSKDLVHFYMEGVRCCGVKPCCKRE